MPEPLPNIGLLICRLGESAEIEIGSDAMTRETWLNKKGLPLGSEKDGALGNRRRNQVDRLAKLGVGGRTWPRVCARDRRRTGRRAVPAAVCIGIGSTEALKNHRSVVGRRDLQFARY